MKKIFVELILPGFIWLYFVSEGVRGGLKLPDIKPEPSDPIPIIFWNIGLTFCFLMGIIVVLINTYRKKGAFEIKFEKYCGKESFEVFKKRVKPQLIGTLFFGLIGVIGLIKSHVIENSFLVKQIVTSPLILSLGILIGWLITLKFKSKRMY